MSPWISGNPPSPPPPPPSCPPPSLLPNCIPLPAQFWHLAILICMYMPSLCGPWASEIDQQCHAVCYRKAGSDTKQTYVHTCTLETWFKGKEKTHIISDSAPTGVDTPERVCSTFKARKTLLTLCSVAQEDFGIRNTDAEVKESATASRSYIIGVAI
ncbi:unnamed protein product [Pleuronectes platessa]|uniref:Uncharacterized protein n=1 Tax=Pleuronectes platessa TaxID=8262 RepID=A0A9N7UP26_PLEPL|nr:unnamed protein product [Pleuronectes platessa]